MKMNIFTHAYGKASDGNLYCKVSDFVEPTEDVIKNLEQHCGVGGSSTGDVLIQADGIKWVLSESKWSRRFDHFTVNGIPITNMELNLILLLIDMGLSADQAIKKLFEVIGLVDKAE